MKLGNILKIATCSLALSQTFAPAANAVMLRGSIETADFVSAQPMPLAGSITAGAKREARANFLQGNWKCISQVVGSSVAGVSVGTIVESAALFRGDRSGNMLQHWTQDRWTPASSAVMRIDSDLMTATHESANQTGAGGSWSARSYDTYKIVAPDRMLAQSTVEQFVNGRFVGTYKTASVLQKISG